jgi:hypothetical protein
MTNEEFKSIQSFLLMLQIEFFFCNEKPNLATFHQLFEIFYAKHYQLVNIS